MLMCFLIPFIVSISQSHQAADNAGNSVVGIAPMAYGDQLVYPEHDPAIHKSFIRSLDLFGSRLLSEQYRLSLFCSDIGIDPPVVSNLESRLRTGCRLAENESVLVPSIHSDTDLLSAMASMDYVVTSRFHGVILAHMLNIPVIAISHHPKVLTLMHALGLTEYCLDIRSCDADRLTETFLSGEKSLSSQEPYEGDRRALQAGVVVPIR